jgi:hypothetical protein
MTILDLKQTKVEREENKSNCVMAHGDEGFQRTIFSWVGKLQRTQNPVWNSAVPGTCNTGLAFETEHLSMLASRG